MGAARHADEEQINDSASGGETQAFKLISSSVLKNMLTQPPFFEVQQNPSAVSSSHSLNTLR